MMLYGTEAGSGVELERLVVERRSIRSFADTPVSPELVRDLLATALWAPSPHNSQPWRFTVLFEAGEKARLADAMADRLATEMLEDGLDAATVNNQTARSRRRISSAPVAILCSLAHDGLNDFGDARRSALEWEMAVQSVGAVLQTLFLLAHERGIGTCWMAAPMYCPEIVREALDLRPEVFPQALVLMGYPALAGKVRARRDLDDVVEFR